MSSTIAAVTTSGGGIIMSGDSSGNLSLLSGATTVVAVTSTGVAVTGTLSATGDVTFTKAGADLDLNLNSTGGSGRSWAFRSDNDGRLLLVDKTAGLGRAEWDSAGLCALNAGLAVTGTLSVSGAVTTPLSYVRLNTTNGYGSTNNKIRRFTNIVNNVGTDITYADSATLGGTFTLNTAGVYSVSCNDQFTSPNWFGVSINSTQLTTAITNITTADILAVNITGAASYLNTASATFYAAATSIVRLHTDGAASSTNTTLCQFTIARVQ
jgi:hypothetical protein